MVQVATAEPSASEEAAALCDRVNRLMPNYARPDLFVDQRSGIARDLMRLAHRLRPAAQPLVVHLGGMSRREAMQRSGPYLSVVSHRSGSTLEADAVFAAPIPEPETTKPHSLAPVARRGRVRRHRFPMPPRLCSDQLALL
jgi:hypothetical protein